MRGQPPKPTRLKVLNGNPGKGRPNENEPKPPVGEPICPDWLGEEAKEKWAEVAPALARLGVLTVIDGDVLATYCQSWCEYRQATKRLAKEGRVVVAQSGYQMPHPMVAQQREARNAIRQFSALLGLDPSSRVRLKADAPEPEDPLEKMLNERHA